MVAAAAILPEGFEPTGIRDSKDMDEGRRWVLD
jgi:hypothetical protein